jgi:hypothetical protein
MADSTIWAVTVSVASPIIAAASALTATWMTNARHDRRAANDADEARRRVDRELVVDVLLPAREWARMMEVLLPAFWKMTAKDLIDFVDTDTGERQRDLINQRDVALTRARLFLSNDSLSGTVGKITTFVGRFPAVVMGPIHKEKANIKVVGNGLAAIDAFSKLVDQLESEAVTLLREPIRRKG